MQIDEPERPAIRETILPMINVVFLLLIFLMMMGRIAEKPDLDINAVESVAGEEKGASLTLFVSNDGQLQFASDHQRDVVLETLKQALIADEEARDLVIRADAGADFSGILELVRILRPYCKGAIKLEVLRK
ncbi:biopolymer transporter ExbD [uncultured Cohaesibacter sp.]|uniref:ExbD/TolR family protein n=1 Tax=uncultured Cohaesibacter sp. TaxID=1002546 RepID=UPI002931ACB2|nr:biopolymer transporter ExbD [uncultured Cohaesibacter sp.]